MPPSRKSPRLISQVPDWFRQARFGMFVHWGIYSVLGHGEQSLFRELLNPSNYRKLAGRFRAEKFNPSDWAATAKAANMKYIVLTAKHHDGFCLWNTSTTDNNAAKCGPGRDLIAEYVSACRRAGLRVGLYFSLEDWSVPAFLAGPERDPEGFHDFIRMSWRQIEELMSNYGRIDLLWFDGVNFPTARHWQSVKLVEMIRRHQPGILINDRLAKPKRGGNWGYLTPEQEVGRTSPDAWESCITSTRKFWGYHRCHEDPSLWHTGRELLEMLTGCVSRGGNLLLNVGPRPSGELPPMFKKRLRFLGRWIRANRAAIYGTEPSAVEFAYGGVATQKGNRLYLFFLYWPGKEYSLPGFNEKLLSARFLADHGKIRALQEPQRIILTGLPQRAPDVCTVIELTFDAPPTPHSWAKCRLHQYPMPDLVEWARK